MDDVESDLSAFHRIDDLATIDGPRFFRFALRLAAYTGALSARLYHEHKEREGTPAGHSTGSQTQQASRVSDAVAIAQLGDWVEHTEE
jgi:hypothetical protein